MDIAEKKMKTNVCSIENEYVKVLVSKDTGAYSFLDKSTGAKWYSSLEGNGFGRIVVSKPHVEREIWLDSPKSVEAKNNLIKLTYPVTIDRSGTGLAISFDLTFTDKDEIAVSYKITGDKGADWQVKEVIILDDALWITNHEDGYLVVPHSSGMMVPSNVKEHFSRKWLTYGYRTPMAMSGAVKDNSAVLVWWDDPYISVKARNRRFLGAEATNVVSMSHSSIKAGGSVYIKLLGKGDYVKIAKAYQGVAKTRKKGKWKTFEDKIKENPNLQLQKLIGAVEFKIQFCIHDTAPDSRYFGTPFLSKHVRYTFDEAAQIAEHVKETLGIDKAFFVLTGWTKYGYDCGHPDILPAAELCGGNEKLAKASEKIRNLGYLFGFHDNYDMMFKKSESCNPSDAIMDEKGQRTEFNVCLGGPQYSTCPTQQMKYIKRNLAEVKKLFHPNVYFTDQLYAISLWECHDPAHPLTREQCIEAYRRLVEYIQSMGCIHGAEDGMEWGNAFSNYYEGIGYPEWDAVPFPKYGRPIPMFDLAYHRCAFMFSHQAMACPLVRGYGDLQVQPLRTTQVVLAMINSGHTIIFYPPPRDYYKSKVWGLDWNEYGEVDTSQLPLARADDGWAEDLNFMDRFTKNVYEILSPLNELTALKEMTNHRFLSNDGQVQETTFEDGVVAVTNRSDSQCEYKGVKLPPYGFWVSSPTFCAFYAYRFNEHEYEEATFFTVKSLDGKPIEESNEIRVFHGFGEKMIKLKTTHSRAVVDSVEYPVKDGILSIEVGREAKIKLM